MARLMLYLSLTNSKLIKFIHFSILSFSSTFRLNSNCFISSCFGILPIPYITIFYKLPKCRLFFWRRIINPLQKVMIYASTHLQVAWLLTIFTRRCQTENNFFEVWTHFEWSEIINQYLRHLKLVCFQKHDLLVEFCKEYGMDFKL